MFTTTITLKIDPAVLNSSRIRLIQMDMKEDGIDDLSIESMMEYIMIQNFCTGSYSLLDVDSDINSSYES
jgi:hypothetical protein